MGYRGRPSPPELEKQPLALSLNHLSTFRPGSLGQHRRVQIKNVSSGHTAWRASLDTNWKFPFPPLPP